MPPKTTNSTRRNLMIDSPLWEELVELSDALGKPSISSLVRTAIEKYLEERNQQSEEVESHYSTPKNGVKSEINSTQSTVFEIKRLKVKCENANRKLGAIQEILNDLDKKDLEITKKINDIQSERMNSFKNFEIEIETLTKEYNEKIEEKKRLKQQDKIVLDQMESGLIKEKESLKAKKLDISQDKENANIHLIDCEEEIFNLENS
jgi:hypothetical protein